MSKQAAIRAADLVTEERSIPASDLVAAMNIRHDVDRERVDEMKASLLSTGQIQNLVAAPRQSDGKIAVFAGGTRLLAVKELVAEGKISADYPVRTLIYVDLDPESPDAIAIAMQENMVRTQMDYVDECAAMAQLAAARKTEEEIAAIFGYRPKTVHERLLIAKLIPEALALVRDKVRNLAWARALTIADVTMQKKICDDIAGNPTSWASGEDIRKFLTQSTVPADHAIFDLDDYKGVIIHDMFDGDKLQDIAAFWELQNTAVADLAKEIEAEGYAEVIVTHEPFASWRFEDEPDNAKALAIVEVMPNGAVTVIRNKVLIRDIDTKVRALDEIEHEASTSIEEIADYEVRATPSICDYAAAQRSAMVQVAIADDFRKALEYTVLAMIGHRGASFSAPTYGMPGNPETRTGLAFAEVAGIAGEVEDALLTEVAEPALRDAAIVGIVRALPDTELQALFARLVSQRAGQTRTRGIDDSEGSLMNVFGNDIDIRLWWTPDAAFFELMASEDLRRLATSLLHSAGASSTRFANAKKKDLVRALSSNFADAREGVLTGEVARSLNAWVPGVMSFPASIEMKADEAFYDEMDDIDSILFDEDDAA